MNYITAATFTLKYTIPPSAAAQSVLNQYHVEIHNISTGVKKNMDATAITPAVAPTTLLPNGTAGTVTFSGVPVPTAGPYLFDVYYDDAASLDAANMTKVGSIAAYKVTGVTTITI